MQFHTLNFRKLIKNTCHIALKQACKNRAPYCHHKVYLRCNIRLKFINLFKEKLYLRSSPTHDIPGADGTFGNTAKIEEKIANLLFISI